MARKRVTLCWLCDLRRYFAVSCCTLFCSCSVLQNFCDTLFTFAVLNFVLIRPHFCFFLQFFMARKCVESLRTTYADKDCTILSSNQRIRRVTSARFSDLRLFLCGFYLLLSRVSSFSDFRRALATVLQALHDQ